MEGAAGFLPRARTRARLLSWMDSAWRGLHDAQAAGRAACTLLQWSGGWCWLRLKRSRGTTPGMR